MHSRYTKIHIPRRLLRVDLERLFERFQIARLDGLGQHLKHRLSFRRFLASERVERLLGRHARAEPLGLGGGGGSRIGGRLGLRVNPLLNGRGARLTLGRGVLELGGLLLGEFLSGRVDLGRFLRCKFLREKTTGARTKADKFLRQSLSYPQQKNASWR